MSTRTSRARVSRHGVSYDSVNRAGTQAIILFLLLAVALPLLVVDDPATYGEIAVALCLTITTFSAFRIAQLTYLGEPSIMGLGFHLFVYPFVGLAGLAQVSSGIFPLGGSYPTAAVVASLVFFMVGIAAYEVTYFLFGLRDVLRPSAIQLRFRQVPTILLGLFGLVFVAFTVLDTGLMPFFTSRDEASTVLAGADVVQIYALDDKTAFLLRNSFTRLPVFVALISSLVLIRQGEWSHGRAGRAGTAVFVGALVLANIVVNNPLSNSRFWFGAVILTLIAVYVPWRTPIGFRFLVYAGLFVFIFAFGLLDVFRRAGITREIAGPQEIMVSNGSYSAVQTAINGTQFLREHPLQGGEQLFTALLTFVPRSIWEGKGIDSGSLIDPVNNRAATLWTEFQLDFGVVGILLGLGLLGVLGTLIDSRMAISTQAAAVLAVLTMGVQILALRGSLVTAMGIIYPLVFFLAFVLSTKPQKLASELGPGLPSIARGHRGAASRRSSAKRD
jgi:hypothetical protein